MGKKSTPTPPPAPDPREIARTDAEFNRIDQFTPGGSLVFSGANRNRADLTLSPELQGLFDQQIQSDSNLLGSALTRQGFLDNAPIDLSQFGDIRSDIDTSNINFSPPNIGDLPNINAPNLGTVGGLGPLQNSLKTTGLPIIPENIEQFRGDVEQSVFDRGRALLDPIFSDQERSLRQRLANQGLPEAGEAFDRDFTRFGDARNRAFTDLANQATITSGQEASRSLGDILGARGAGIGEGLASGNFANNAALGNFGANLQSQGFNNQAGLLGLGANQNIRGQLSGEQLAQSAANNQASSLNLGLQQQLLANENQARSQSLAESLGIRGNQFNELASLLGLQQVQAPGLDSFFAPSQADVFGAFALNQQAQQNAFNAQTQQQGDALGGLFGLGGAILGGPIGGAIGKGIGGLFDSKPQQGILINGAPI